MLFHNSSFWLISFKYSGLAEELSCSNLPEKLDIIMNVVSVLTYFAGWGNGEGSKFEEYS
ncbi:protein of unknown function [Maridesulfovibrio hydrothermalis AM13 = DSM 14728]|uniref:Uncharacterized protein n=1 Tax=Maridesulfovibrio hydrothermalis AM13 = DSM 14728 TaxID=1121451 RepID=L0RDA6_9BACT|nr:protein of unknown function [Maridesulfovibrio hydrothermalis AM13 = DSM 14728]